MTLSVDETIALVESADLTFQNINYWPHRDIPAKWSAVLLKSRPGKVLGYAAGDGLTMADAIHSAYLKIVDAELEDITLIDKFPTGQWIGITPGPIQNSDLSNLLTKIIADRATPAEPIKRRI